jgi:type VI protein secretion system component VasF
MSAILKGMALFVRQNEERSELQQRLATELQERAKQRAKNDGARPDGVEDSHYLKDTKTTTSLAGVWIAVVAVALIIVVIYIISQVS